MSMWLNQHIKNPTKLHHCPTQIQPDENRALRMSMDSESPPLRVFIFPFMAPGHMIPMVDMARLLGSHGVRYTVVTTPINQTHISQTIEQARSAGVDIDVKTIPFQAAEVGLPDGCENLDMLPSTDLFLQFFQAANLLRGPLEQLLEEEMPDCLISDHFFPWTLDSAQKFDIPRVVFHGTSFFAMCAMEIVRVHKPYKSVSSDSEPFVIPNLPDEIRITRTQFPVQLWENDEDKGLGKVAADARKSTLRSFGVVVNSFKELEHAYADHYRNVLQHRAWHVGPVSLCNRNAEEKAMRGKPAAIEERECLKWLDSKRPDSVVYVCFGSGVRFPDAQLRDIASGLEDSGQNFIWVVRRGEADSADYLPEGFEERVKDRGLLIFGWAPQVLILDHPSVGGFVTHCGWNSVLEGISAGLPMVTWPLFAEQFCNEKLITDVLKTGVGVGTKKWSRNGEDHMRSDQVEKAVRLLMEGEEAEERRRRARQLGRTAKLAVEKDGSSYADLQNLLAHLKSRRNL